MRAWLLWSRLASFDPRELADLLQSRQAVRTLLMRRTLHLVTAADCLALRSLHQSMLVARAWSTPGRRLPGVDPSELVAARDLGDALSSLVPLVQVPPRGIWGQQGPAP